MAGKSTVAQLNVLLSLDSSRMTRGLRMAQGRISTFSKAGGKMMASFGNVAAGAFTAVALGAGAAATAATKMGLEFDKSMTKIITLVGIAKEDVDAMRQSVQDMAADTGKNSKEAADALFFITSAGLRGKEAMEALEASLKGAAMGLGETKSIADIVTATMNAYGKGVYSATDATDILTNTVRLGKLEAEGLAGVMGTVIPVAAQMGVAFEEVGAAFAGMSKTGSAADTAKIATQLRQILVTLLKPTKEGADELRRLGLSADGIRQTIKEDGLLSGLMQLKVAFNGNAESTAKVFGNVRALTGVMDLLGNNAADNVAIFDEMADSVGVTDDAFNKWEQSISGKAELTMSAFKKTIGELGDIILASSGGLSDWALNFTRSLPTLYNKMITFLEDTANGFVDLYNNASAFRIIIEAISGAWKIMYQWVLLNKNLLTDLFGIITSGFTNLMMFLSGESVDWGDWWDNQISGFKDSFTNFGEAAQSIVKEGMDNVVNGGMQKVSYSRMLGKTAKSDATIGSGGNPMDAIRRTMGLRLMEDKARMAIEFANKPLDLASQKLESMTEVVGKMDKAFVNLGTSIAGAFEDAFDAMLNGESVFKSLIQGLVGLIKKLIAAAIAAAILAALLPSSFFGLADGASFGDKFKAIFSAMGGLPSMALGKATGGRVSAGSPYMVGERGREMFVPDHSGKIVPHGRTEGQYGGGGAIQVEGVLSGQDILLSSARTSRYNKRYGS